MDRGTTELGITGGEPTLLGQRFLELVATCAANLPDTGLHVLTNGRKFNYLSLARAVAAVNHHDLMLGIPLYSDLAWHHDFVVQAVGAFDQTIRGILNLARCGVPVEIRIVVHRHTVERLAHLCAFIARNLPFVRHVAIMGLEPIGFGKTNLDSLWIDAVDYQAELNAGVSTLRDHGLNVSLYNHQLCVLPQSLWPFARQSISDWKNVYLPECAECAVQGDCAGFFHSAVHAHSRAIRPIRQDELSTETSTRSSSC
jgi:His-Xaa-Ser system radical SAM maturase HxsC